MRIRSQNENNGKKSKKKNKKKVEEKAIKLIKKTFGMHKQVTQEHKTFQSKPRKIYEAK